tara:strand:+ start:2354 stop:2503 length:150 start_codon:yes stop_codon:yes gene_type:complete
MCNNPLAVNVWTTAMVGLLISNENEIFGVLLIDVVVLILNVIFLISCKN